MCLQAEWSLTTRLTQICATAAASSNLCGPEEAWGHGNPDTTKLNIGRHLHQRNTPFLPFNNIQSKWRTACATFTHPVIVPHVTALGVLPTHHFQNIPVYMDGSNSSFLANTTDVTCLFIIAYDDLYRFTYSAFVNGWCLPSSLIIISLMFSDVLHFAHRGAVLYLAAWRHEGKFKKHGFRTAVAIAKRAGWWRKMITWATFLQR